MANTFKSGITLTDYFRDEDLFATWGIYCIDVPTYSQYKKYRPDNKYIVQYTIFPTQIYLKRLILKYKWTAIHEPTVQGVM